MARRDAGLDTDALPTWEADGSGPAWQRENGKGLVPVDELLPASSRVPRLRELARGARADPAGGRVAGVAARLRRGLTSRAQAAHSRRAVDVREMAENEPALFTEGGREAFREACKRLARPCSLADADALFALVDDDRDGACSKRELIAFARDAGGA